MVGPIYLIAVPLGVAFLMGLLKNLGMKIPWIVMLLSLAGMTFVSAEWFWELYFDNYAPQYIFTAGFTPPFSINLLMGKYEALLTMMINGLGFVGGMYLYDKFKEQGINSIIVFLVMIMALNVVIMTRDIFNLFVFLEIVSIATAGLILLDKNINSLSAGFKYMIATGIIAGLLLIGIVFAYYFAGSLNIDDLIASKLPMIKGGSVAIFLIFISVIFELKPFPANGWALDTYEGAPVGVSSMISSGVATAGLFVLHKLIPIGGTQWLPVLVYIGLITFIGSNLLGLNQSNAKRLLGYSSVGQIGLMMTVIGLAPKLGVKFEFIIFTILISHFFAKAGLFWISGLMEKKGIKFWGILSREPSLILAMAIFILALLGLPPFPSFFGKWELIMALSAGNNLWIVFLILLGSFIEAVYLFRWFGYAARAEEISKHMHVPFKKLFPIIIFALSLIGISYYTIEYIRNDQIAWMIPFAIVVGLLLLDFLPAVIKNILVIASLGYYSYFTIYKEMWFGDDVLRLVFATIFVVGGVFLLIPGFNFKGKRMGLYPMLLLMFVGLTGLIEAKTTLEFFFAWEIMTIGSYFLIIRGKKSMKPALSYITFSIAGAYFLMIAFGLSFASSNSLSLDLFTSLNNLTWWIAALVSLGLLIKMASLGFHLWLPGSYAETENDVTPIISSILIKSGLFGFIVLFASARNIWEFIPVDIPYILGWLGAITAIVGNMKAIYQEDVKKLVAYSSIGVMGYIIFSVAMMSNLGWMTAVTYAIVHFLYKALIFLAIAGVIYRTRTRKIYEMGGLIKQMPLSFISVLIGIITLAGMPPLAGFAGKWMMYNAVIIKGWYIQGAMVFFAGIIAFLYCFKLIHNIFLGPVKDNHRKLKETTIWWLIPQFILIGGIMFMSVQPKIVLEPIGNYLSTFMAGEGLKWQGGTAYTSIGYWNATNIMFVVGGMFAVLFGTLFLLSRKAQKVGMFDMVYQAERPTRPETHHYAYNMFAHYNKATGFMIIPWITKFWTKTGEFVHDIGNHIRKIYSGNAQAYALHIVMYLIIAYVLIAGGF